MVITLLAIATICGVFWLGSRYPSLQSKAGADPDEALSTPLGFESHLAEPRSDEKLKRIGWVAAEWAITNKQGMTFGVLLAAGLLTLVPLLPRRRGGKFAGSVQGLLHRHAARRLRELRRADRPGDAEGREQRRGRAGSDVRLAELQRDRPRNGAHALPLVPRRTQGLDRAW